MLFARLPLVVEQDLVADIDEMHRYTKKQLRKMLPDYVSPYAVDLNNAAMSISIPIGRSRGLFQTQAPAGIPLTVGDPEVESIPATPGGHDPFGILVGSRPLPEVRSLVETGRATPATTDEISSRLKDLNVENAMINERLEELKQMTDLSEEESKQLDADIDRIAQRQAAIRREKADIKQELERRVRPHQREQEKAALKKLDVTKKLQDERDETKAKLAERETIEAELVLAGDNDTDHYHYYNTTTGETASLGTRALDEVPGALRTKNFGEPSRKMLASAQINSHKYKDVVYLVYKPANINRADLKKEVEQSLRARGKIK